MLWWYPVPVPEIHINKASRWRHWVVSRIMEELNMSRWDAERTLDACLMHMLGAPRSAPDEAMRLIPKLVRSIRVHVIVPDERYPGYRIRTYNIILAKPSLAIRRIQSAIAYAARPVSRSKGGRLEVVPEAYINLTGRRYMWAEPEITPRTLKLLLTECLAYSIIPDNREKLERTYRIIRY